MRPTDTERMQITQTDLQTTLDKFTQTNSIFLTAILSGLYVCLAVLHLILLPSPVAKVLTPLALGTAGSMLGLRWLLQKHVATPHYAHGFATLIAALIYTNCIVHLYLTRDLKQATNLMLLIVGVGFAHLHKRWYWWNLFYMLGGWFIVSSLIASPDNLHFGIGMASATVLSFFVNRSRVRNISQMVSWRLQSEQRSRDLEVALADAEKAQHELQIALQALEKTKEELEDRVQERTAELHRSNRELQDFASIASHDLQEPLRKVQAFGSRLHDKYGEVLGEKGKDYLARMQNAAGRMQTLIDDLLTFSRVTSKAKPFETVDLAQIIAEVMADLEIRMEQTKGRIEIDNLPVLQADPTQMRQLLQNLIGNALKFHKPNETPVVKIRCEVVEPFFRIEISDNGIGFDEKYSEQIFAIFQRLHGREAYEGTGVGLAVCRKIVERHGGTILAQSTPQQGATFIIKLPYKTREKSVAAHT